MDNICILKNGLAVKLPEDIFQNLIYDIDGFLISFEFQKETSFVKYHFYYSDEFKNIRYNGKSYVPDGYYLEEKAILYFAYKQGTAFTQSIAPTPVELKENYCFKYIDFENNYPANIDDEVTVTSINSSLPNFIYEENKAVFKIIKNVDNTPKLYYLKSNKKIDFPIKLEIGNGFVSYELSQVDNFLDPNRPDYINSLGYFYQKNFSERVSGWLATTDTIQKMDRITTLITLRINKISRVIFPLLSDLWVLIDAVGTQQPGHTLSDLDTNLLKILYEIKKGWAMYYYPNTPGLDTYIPILPNEGYYPDYEAYNKYYTSLVNFYSSCYRIKPFLLNETSDDKKLELLIKCLGPSSLQVIPIDLRIDILVDFAKNKIYEDKENLVLKIVESIDPADSTYFLAKLQSTILPENNENKTLFETLYDKINDQILWIGKDNRKTLMLKLFNLWYVSEFNPSFNTNDFEDDITNYDNIELGLLGYTSNTVMLNYNHEKSFGFYTDNMSFNFSDRKIEVHEDKQEVIKISPNYGNDYQTERVTTVSKLVGTYNYFQAISLSDYKENDVAIKIPLVDLNQNGQNVTALLPLFYLKYMDDFGDNEDLWTGIGLAFDVALTFTGIGNLSKLRHLRHIGKFGRAFRAWRTGTQTSETLFILKGIWSSAQGIGALLEISSSFVSIYLNYTTNNCNDYRNQVNQNINDASPNGQLPDDTNESVEFKRCKQLDQILFWIQIGSLGLDVLASKMIKKHARQLEDLGYPASWDVGDFLQLKQKFQGINAAGLDNFQSFINQIPTSFRSNVESKLLSYTSDQRMLFLDDFIDTNITEEFWQKMVQNGGEAMDNWKLMLINNISSERKLFEYLENTNLTNYLIRYYSDDSLKVILKRINEADKQKFLLKYGSNNPINTNLFNKLSQNPSKFELLLESQSSIKRGQLDFLDDADILSLIDSNLSENLIDLLRIKNKYLLKQLIKNFRRDINNVDIDINRLRDIQNGDAFSFFSSLSNNKKKKFQSVNKLLVKFQTYNNDVPIGGITERNFLAGRQEFISSIFNNGLPGNFIEPFDYNKFNLFKKKAFDLDSVDRFNDTELKFIFDFIENHWNTGNKFVIEMESTLYSCSSCQGYLLYLKKLADDSGKIIEITIKANKKARNYKSLNETIH